MFRDLSDDELMEKVKLGDQAAFGSLLNRHGGAVLGMTLRLLGGNRARAEDITQTTWLKLLEKCHLYQPQGHFRAWLMTVARHEALGELRKSARFSDTEEGFEETVADSFDLAGALERRETRASVKAKLDGLPPEQRTALVLWLGGDLSYEQIAQELGISLGAVKTHIHRAKATLKKRLEDK